jgi:hypothetical protein
MLTDQWGKSTWSADGTGCLEARLAGDFVLVRDTKQAGRGPGLAFTHHEWEAFLEGARGGEFDLP